MGCMDEKAGLLLERSFAGDLDAPGRVALHAHLAGCADCRARYERQVRVERALERSPGPLPESHLNQIGEAVIDRVLAAERPVRPAWHGWWWKLLPIPLAAAAVALVLVDRPDDGFQARSGAPARVEGLRAFCIGGTAGDPRIVAAADAGRDAVLRCALGGSLQFSYSTGGEPLHLAIVSLPESGEGAALHYVEGTTLQVPPGAVDQPLPYSSRLAARHAVGTRSLYALFFAQAPSVAEVEEAARLAQAGKHGRALVVHSLRLVIEPDAP